MGRGVEEEGGKSIEWVVAESAWGGVGVKGESEMSLAECE